ncbi:hypothetical protein [Modestobacter roseus]|uniref:PH (Pleckstrin Homology) domain-containing protein n=1 Tax=Modestobacter roseus TaxID=1181884 RepID=A0A562ILI5_9ACTN|nr:hypothetical protein [Modestobacter roseus]MQA34294.1 hypothetical protein [Modestobacter roseus]TWH71869.1 hypothetical protein JD78_00369 [Modestobacter roseus]
MSYRPIRGARWAFPLLFAVFAVAAVALVAATLRGDGPPLLFLLLWLGALGWNAYWFLLRVCVELRVDGPQLEWATPLRRGTVSLLDVALIRRSRLSNQLAVIELRTGRPLMVPVRYGFAAVEQEIVAGSPGVEVEEP